MSVVACSEAADPLESLLDRIYVTHGRQTPRELVYLLVASVSSLVEVGAAVHLVTKLLSRYKKSHPVALVNSVVKFVTAELSFANSTTDDLNGFLTCKFLTVIRALIFGGSLKRALLLHLYSGLWSGWSLHQEAKEVSMQRSLKKHIFPFKDSNDAVVASSAEALLYSLVHNGARGGKEPIVVLPAVLMYPHNTMVPFLQEQQVTMDFFDVDCTYEADEGTLHALLLSHTHKPNTKVFLVLPTIHARRLKSILSICSMARKLGCTTVEVTVPTVDFCSFPELCNNLPLHIDAADATIVSFKSACCLDCAVGAFKSRDSAEACQELCDALPQSSVVSLWLTLVRETLNYFVSTRLGFNLSVYAITLLSPRPVAVGSKQHKIFSTSSLDVANLLLFYKRHLRSESVATQSKMLWMFLSSVPKYIHVVSADETTMREKTEAACGGVVLYTTQPAELQNLLLKKHFCAAKVAPWLIEEVRKPFSMRSAVYSSRGANASSWCQNLLWVSLHDITSDDHLFRLIAALESVPKAWFEGPFKERSRGNDAEILAAWVQKSSKPSKL